MIIKIKNYKINAKVCNSFISKAIGLMFALKPRNLLFVFNKEVIRGLHMLFVFFPIDVVFLDKNKKVVELKEGFMPFTFYRPRNKAMYVLEMAKGSVRRYRIKLGQRAIFKYAY